MINVVSLKVVMELIRKNEYIDSNLEEKVYYISEIELSKLETSLFYGIHLDSEIHLLLDNRDDLLFENDYLLVEISIFTIKYKSFNYINKDDILDIIILSGNKITSSFINFNNVRYYDTFRRFSFYPRKYNLDGFKYRKVYLYDEDDKLSEDDSFIYYLSCNKKYPDEYINNYRDFSDLSFILPEVKRLVLENLSSHISVAYTNIESIDSDIKLYLIGKSLLNNL